MGYYDYDDDYYYDVVDVWQWHWLRCYRLCLVIQVQMEQVSNSKIWHSCRRVFSNVFSYIYNDEIVCYCNAD
jgi:hypothetical protein